MSFQMLFLGSESTSTITAVSVVVDTFRVGSEATAGVRFKSTGLEQTIRNESLAGVGDWVTPVATASQWEIRATLDSGDVPLGALGTWLPLTSDQTWTVVASVDTFVTSVLTFEFRKVGGGAAEFTITGTSLSAEATGML